MRLNESAPVFPWTMLVAKRQGVDHTTCFYGGAGGTAGLLN